LNQLLSEKRANAVRNYLISKGVEEKRITAKGYGDTKPVASNKTTQGKAKNRRVEFIVTFEEVTFE
jgi:outer membrane protein OmpA-like peptidoglycan-associated protein